MAQEVSHYEDNVTFTEGPFVISNPLGNGYRIEVDLKGHPCPVLPDCSIYRLLGEHGFYAGKCPRKEIAKIADWLNEQVLLERIVCQTNGWWVRLLQEKEEKRES